MKELKLTEGHIEKIKLIVVENQGHKIELAKTDLNSHSVQNSIVSYGLLLLLYRVLVEANSILPALVLAGAFSIVPLFFAYKFIFYKNRLKEIAADKKLLAKMQKNEIPFGLFKQKFEQILARLKKTALQRARWPSDILE